MKSFGYFIRDRFATVHANTFFFLDYIADLGLQGILICAKMLLNYSGNMKEKAKAMHTTSFFQQRKRIEEENGLYSGALR